MFCYSPFQIADTMSSSGGGSVSMEDQSQPAQTYCLKWNNHQGRLT